MKNLLLRRLRPARLALALVVSLAAAGFAQADESADVRRELDALRGQIAQLDMALADTDKDGAAANTQAERYAARLKANAATGETLQQQARELTARAAQLESERAAAETLCRKTTATAEAYQAALAQCEKARQAYDRRNDAYRADQQRFTGDYAAYEAEAKALEARYRELQQQRQDILAKQASLHDARQQALDHFNQLRDRLAAMPSGAR